MTPDVAAAIARIQSGQGGPVDMAILQRALFGMAPSSPEYRQIATVLGQGGGPSFEGSTPTAPSTFPGQPPSSPGGQTAAQTQVPDFNWDVGQIAGSAQPTLDWVEQALPGSDAAQRRAAETMQDAPTREVPPIPGNWDQFMPGSQAAVDRAGQTMIPGPTKADPGAWDPRPASSTAAAVNANQARLAEAGGGGNRLNTAVQGGGEGWHGIPLSGGTTMPDDDLDPAWLGVAPDEGYTWSGSTPQGFDLLSQNAGAYLNQYSEKQGGGANMAAFLQDPYMAAKALSQYGILGSSGTQDIYGGANKQPVEMQADIENFLNEYNKQGMQVNPGVMAREILSRAEATNWAETLNKESGLAYTPDQIIDYTNEAMMTSALFLSPEGFNWLQALLESAKQEYIKGVSSGEINTDAMSYPAYLKQQGYDTLLG